MAKKILKLDFTESYDFTLFALVCSLKDFKLCFELNQVLNANLRRQENIEITDRQRNRHLFTNFYQPQQAGKQVEQLRLISNRSANGFFIPEKKNIDYFLMIKDCGKESIKEIFNKLKKSEVVEGVYQIELTELKSVDNFLYFE